MKTEAEFGGMQRPAKQHQGLLELPEAGGGKKELPLEPSEGVQPCRHLGLVFLASRTVRGNSYCFMPPSLW